MSNSFNLLRRKKYEGIIRNISSFSQSYISSKRWSGVGHSLCLNEMLHKSLFSMNYMESFKCSSSFQEKGKDFRLNSVYSPNKLFNTPYTVCALHTYINDNEIYQFDNSNLESYLFNHYSNFIPLTKDIVMSNNSPIVTASWAANNILTLQQHAFEQKLELVSINNFELSKDSFDKLKDMFDLCTKNKLLHKTTFLSKKETNFEYVDPTSALVCLQIIEQEDSTKYYLDKSYTTESWYNKFKHLIQIQEKKSKVSWITSFDGNEHPRITELDITVPGPYNPLVYPTIGSTVQDFKNFIQGYKDTSASVLLMLSKPGEGKTTFIKHMLRELNESCLITYSDELKNMDALFAYFLTSDENYLIIEDADNYLTSRERDGNNFSMKKLLNITDGLTSNPKKKVIFTANFLNIDNVDPALKRPGRCYKVLTFPSLTKEQAIAFFHSELDGKLPELIKENDMKSEYSVAELYSYLNGFDPTLVDTISKPKGGFGLIRGVS